MHTCIHHLAIHYEQTGSKISDQFICLVLERKQAVKAYLIKNSKGEGRKDLTHKQSEGLGGVLWMYKVGLKRPVIAMAVTRKHHCRLSVSFPVSSLSQTSFRCAKKPFVEREMQASRQACTDELSFVALMYFSCISANI